MRNKGAALVAVSVAVFLVLNLIENLIHYTIGRMSASPWAPPRWPTAQDWIFITITMAVFALAQGLGAYGIDRYFKLV
jgi:hypothetical protein